MVFVEGEDYRALRRPGDDPAQFRSVVRPGLVPDSVVHQYTGDNFTTTTWPDNIGSADMSIQGPSVTTLGPNNSPAAISDGVDDVGETPLGTVETIPQNEAFGLAFTLKSTDSRDLTATYGVIDNQNTFQIFDSNTLDGSTGELRLFLNDGGRNETVKETDNDLLDGSLKLVVVNKLSDDAADINFYTDDSDITTPIPSTVQLNRGFDHTQYSPSLPASFFALNNDGTNDFFQDMQSSFFEFNSEPYSSQERKELIQRVDAV
jgi:hypothetical protein